VEPAPEQPSSGSSAEPADEFGEVTPQGEAVMPSEPLDEAVPARGGEEAEPEEAPEGTGGARRVRARERRKGGFGEGIL
jgi:hypothetical protein